jgi:hypothetical protein
VTSRDFAGVDADGEVGPESRDASQKQRAERGASNANHWLNTFLW